MTPLPPVELPDCVRAKRRLVESPVPFVTQRPATLVTPAATHDVVLPWNVPEPATPVGTYVPATLFPSAERVPWIGTFAVVAAVSDEPLSDPLIPTEAAPTIATAMPLTFPPAEITKLSQP